MSNRLTFSLASLIFLIALGLVFVATPAMAHTDVTDPHAHKSAPTVSMELYNPMVGTASTARDGSVQLVADVAASTPALRTAGDSGSFAVVVTFSEVVFDTIDGGNTSLDATGVDSEFTITAAARSASSNNLYDGTAITTVNPTRLDGSSTPTLATVIGDGDEVAGQVYLLVFTVNDATANMVDDRADATSTDDDSIDVWITLNADAAFNRTGLVNGTNTYGIGNAASMRKQFTIVKTLPPVVLPTVTITAPGATIDAAFTATLTFSEAVSALAASDITVTGGAAGTPTEDTTITDGTVWKVDINPYAGVTAVTVGVKAAKATGKSLSVTATADSTKPTVAITSNGDQSGRTLPIKITVADETALGTETGDATLEVTTDSTTNEVTVTGGMLGTLTKTGNEYTGNITIDYDTTSVTVTVAEGAVKDASGNESLAATKAFTVTSTPTPVDLVDGQFMIPAKSYIVVGHDGGTMGLPGSVTAMVWKEMPNLEDLFFRGGSLLLTTLKATKLDRDGKADTADEEAKALDVLITEIMAARDTAKVGQAGYLSHQWIEIYNKLPVAVSVTLSAKSGRPAPAAADTEVALDLVSNVVNPGWDFTGLGADGDTTSTALQPFVSFYRNNRGEPGWQKNRWTTSTDAYLRNHRGTPGAIERSGSVAVGATNPTYNVVINEIGNYADDKYDWIELRNVNQGDGNIKKWQIREITGDKKEKTILNMPDNDHHKIGGVGSVLLIVATDPYRDPDHPLAAGINITHGNGRLEKTGLTSRYYVAGTGFKLSNSGKTLLLLRSRNDGGTHEGIVDLTGTHFIEDQSKDFATDVWPLKGQKGGNDNHGHGDVVKGADEDFREGHVYQRINAGRGTGKEVWERKGYTGVGYKRSATNIGQHGGTPGYDNGAVKVNESELASSATISISEIMYAKGRNLPQWIELYNSSMTQAINLAEWKLKIEHSRDADDVDIRIPAVTTNNLGGTIIQPNQTVLIVSNTTGRVSRGAQGGRDFPAARIVDLWKQKDKLEVDSTKNRLTYRLISETAFKITLMDKSGTAVDTVGNLGATTAWELPMAGDGEGRSSIIRRYDDGVPRDGTMAPSGDGMGPWVLASESPLAGVRVNETYYGSPSDAGTPGYRGGGPLPVSLSKFRPERLESGEIVIRWITQSELNNAGFNILRGEKRDGEFKQINTKLIAGQGTTSEKTTYEWKDTSAKPNVVYYYQIQDVSLDGQVQTLRTSRLKGHISPAGKATTTWGELKALQ